MQKERKDEFQIFEFRRRGNWFSFKLLSSPFSRLFDHIPNLFLCDDLRVERRRRRFDVLIDKEGNRKRIPMKERRTRGRNPSSSRKKRIMRPFQCDSCFDFVSIKLFSEPLFCVVSEKVLGTERTL